MRGGGKVNKDWIDLEFGSPDAINADVLVYDGTASIKTKIESLEQGGGAPSTITEIEYFTLTPSDISHKYVTLTYTPYNSEIEFTIIGGVEQQYQLDYILRNTKQINWSSSYCHVGLTSVLQVGDVLQITYTRSNN